MKPVRRTTFKELQATPLEKFCIRYIYVTVILALGFILAFVCADALRMLLIGVIDGEYVCGLPVLINEMSHANTQPVSRSCYIIRMIVEGWAIEAQRRRDNCRALARI